MKKFKVLLKNLIPSNKKYINSNIIWSRFIKLILLCIYCHLLDPYPYLCFIVIIIIIIEKENRHPFNLEFSKSIQSIYFCRFSLVTTNIHNYNTKIQNSKNSLRFDSLIIILFYSWENRRFFSLRFRFFFWFLIIILSIGI